MTHPIPDAEQRNLALDPQHSCIVQAPAGSGKTTLLAQRYVNLLAGVQRPEEILAITFTKKAAAEMRHRVLALLTQRNAQNELIRQRDKELNWHLFSNPNVLKIQTIDSFAMELANQTPDLGRAGTSIQADPTSLYQAAIDAFIAHLVNNTERAPVVADFVAFMGNDVQRVSRLLQQMLAKRDQWLDVVTSVATDRHPAYLGELLQVTLDHLRQALEGQLLAQFHEDDTRMLQRACEYLGISNDLMLLVPELLTKAGTLRKRFPASSQTDDKELRRELSAWLADLHERDIAPAFITLGHLPGQVNDTEHTATLRLCCVCLSLLVIELEEIFVARAVTDFTGLLLQARAALDDADGASDLALHLDARIQHLLIDEFQDTSRAQASFFSQLVAEWQEQAGNTVFLVGDPMQSIYRFRDADVAIFTETQHSGFGPLPLQKISLTANFRSAAELVNWCNVLFSSHFRAAPEQAAGALGEVPYSAAQPMADIANGTVQCLKFASPTEEVTHLTEHIRHLLAADTHSNIAILCRVRNHITPLLAHLREQNIDYQATDMDSLSLKPVVSDLMSLYQVLLCPANQLAWHSLLRSPMFGTTLSQLSLQRAGGLFPKCLDLEQAPQRRLLQARQWAEASLYEVPVREVLEGFWLRCGGLSAYSTDECTHAMAWFELIEDLQHEAYDFTRVQQALGELFANAANSSRLQVMTIHKAKGLEFDHVLVPNLGQRSRPDDIELLSWRPDQHGMLMGIHGDPIHQWLRYEEQQRARNEDKRLLYVACTRAKQSLLVSYVDQRPAGLALLLQQVAQTPQIAAYPPQSTTVPNVQAELFSQRRLRRLTPDYQWQPPAYDALPSRSATAVETDVIGAREEVMLGNLVHRALAWYASADSSRRNTWPAHLSRWAAELGAGQALSAEMVSACTEHINRTLADADGQWLLADHEQAACELALSASGGVRIVIDRTFVADGYRWIIDYKTSTPAQFEADQLQAFLTAQTARYQAQLWRYREIARQAYAQPVKLALYFTGLGHLQPISG